MKTSFYPNLQYNPLAIAQLAGGLLKTGVGLIQRGKANKWLKNNQEPVEGLQREFGEGQAIANNMANTGMPSEQYNLAMQNIQRQQLSALRGANDRRGGILAVAGNQAQGNDAVAELDAQNAAARQNNQRYAVGVNNQVGNIKRDLFDKNVRQRYLRKYEEMMGQLGSGNQNLTGGIDSLASAGIGMIGQGGGNAGGGDGGIGGGVDFDSWWGSHKPKYGTFKNIN